MEGEVIKGRPMFCAFLWHFYDIIFVHYYDIYWYLCRITWQKHCYLHFLF